MAQQLRLEIVTPERRLFEADVDSVTVPGFDGELGVLPGHTELVSQLKPAGLLTYHAGDQKGQMAISGGFVEIGKERVVILADHAARPEDIDVARALERKQKAEEQLSRASANPDIDIVRAAIEIERATIELQLAGGLQR